MSDIKVRDLIVDDLFTVASILMSITGEARTELSGLLAESDKKSKAIKKENKANANKDHKPEQKEIDTETGIKLALIVFQACFHQAETKMKDWVADIIGKSTEEFSRMPIKTPLLILEELQKKEDIKAFFSEAFALYKKMNGSAAAYIEK